MLGKRHWIWTCHQSLGSQKPSTFETRNRYIIMLSHIICKKKNAKKKTEAPFLPPPSTAESLSNFGFQWLTWWCFHPLRFHPLKFWVTRLLLCLCSWWWVVLGSQTNHGTHIPSVFIQLVCYSFSPFALLYVCTSATWVKTRGVSHCGLAIYIKKYLRQKKKNYGNSNISPWKNVIFKKSSQRSQNP
jgi:hypothetical protein